MSEYIKEDRYIKLSQALEVLDSCCCWYAHDRMELIKAAEVCPVVDVEEAVDEAIRILNAINSSGRMDYEDYSKLHDAICTISPNCGADMRGEGNG